jgi:hypothetical protein
MSGSHEALYCVEANANRGEELIVEKTGCR